MTATPLHEAILSVKNLHAGYNDRAILRDVGFDIVRGQRVALIGPNGSGKSTLFKVIAGLARAREGVVALEGRDLDAWDIERRMQAGIGYLAQTRNIFTTLTVGENLRLAGGAGATDEILRSRVEMLMTLFPQVALAWSRRSGLLSGGQRQMLAVAMVLMRKPKILLLDEPVAGLSPVVGGAMLQGLHEVSTADNIPFVIVEHRLQQLQPYVDRILVMREGRIVGDTPDTNRMLDAGWLAGQYLTGTTTPL